MPKKTKREKIIAEYRRKLQHVTKASGNPSENVTSTKTDTTLPASNPFPYQFNKSISPTPRYVQSVDTTEFTAIRQDLTKTLILAAISIMIELAFYLKLKT